jgi:hypothetical protein
MSVAARSPVLTITDARERAAAALAPIADSDPNVQTGAGWVDSVSPPALILAWADPWLEPDDRKSCRFYARLTVLAVAGRVELDAGVAMLEELVSYVIDRLHQDGYEWGAPTVGFPYRQPLGGIEYLASQVRYRTPVYTTLGA